MDANTLERVPMVKLREGKMINKFMVKRVGGQMRRVGVLVAGIDEDNTIRYGWSRAAISRKDEYDNETAMRIAKERMLHEGITVCPSFAADMEHFDERAVRYFQDATKVMPWIVQAHKPIDEQIIAD